MSTAKAPDEDSDYFVDFTSEQANAAVICRKCYKEFPPGTKLGLLHSKTHGSDRLFCPPCFEYYQNKVTTVRRSKKGMHQSKTCLWSSLAQFSF